MLLLSAPHTCPSSPCDRIHTTNESKLLWSYIWLVVAKHSLDLLCRVVAMDINCAPEVAEALGEDTLIDQRALTLTVLFELLIVDNLAETMGRGLHVIEIKACLWLALLNIHLAKAELNGCCLRGRLVWSESNNDNPTFTFWYR